VRALDGRDLRRRRARLRARVKQRCG
jgi:hypothetical protein